MPEAPKHENQRALPGSTGLHRVLPGFTGLYLVTNEIYQVLPNNL